VIYRARTIKRPRRSKAEVQQLDKQILEAFAADHPLSIRHVFYLMTNPRLPESVEKSERGYRHVQSRCVLLRRSGDLPYWHVTDASRRGYHTFTYGSAAEFLRSMQGAYRQNLWEQADHYCEVWVESRSIGGVVEDVCEELAVSLYPAGGFSSITFVYQAAEMINCSNNDRPVTVFYIGDYDPAGVLIDVVLQRELEEHLDSYIEFDFQRIAITEEQIKSYDLPTKPRKHLDRRSLHITETVEAEAMPAGILRELLRQHVEDLLPEHALQVAKVAEESEQDHIERMADLLEAGG